MIAKVINDDGSSKMVVIYERMDAFNVCIMLAKKNRQTFEPNWTLVQRLEDFDLSNNYVVLQMCYIKQLPY